MATLNDILDMEHDKTPWVLLPAEDAATLLREVVDEYHSDRLHVDDIGCFYVRSRMRERGKDAIARVRRVSVRDQIAYATSMDFRVEINWEAWQALDDDERRAALDHEMCHCDYDEDSAPILLPHDLQEFRAVVERHGLWAGDVVRMARVMQPHLPGLQLEADGEARVAARGREGNRQQGVTTCARDD